MSIVFFCTADNYRLPPMGKGSVAKWKGSIRARTLTTKDTTLLALTRFVQNMLIYPGFVCANSGNYPVDKSRRDG
jgi:hypothetical protein